MNSYNQKVIFHLPGIFEQTNLYKTLLSLYKENRDLFMDNLTIGSIYGSPGLHIWNGGRFADKIKTKEILLDIKGLMESLSIPVRLTFTNCLLEEKHLNDTMCNNTTEIFHSTNNEILCNSKILETYLRSTYPKYSFISSTTKGIKTVEDLNEELKQDYKLVVLDFDLNNKKDLLKNICNKEKVEMLCNACCFSNCPRRKEHYTGISKAQLENACFFYDCEAQFNTFDKVQRLPHFISKDLINEYSAMGFINFKLEGRSNHPLDIIEILLYYLIKEEHQSEVRSILQRSVW